MNLAQLIDQFELVTDTEEGLEQLRKIILKQAIRGNLTKRDPNDEPAKKLLERIEAEKNLLSEEGKIRKPKDIPEVEISEFNLPLNWEWCRLGDLMTYTNGYAFKSSAFVDKGIGVVKIGDLQDGSVTEIKMNYINPLIKEKIGDKYDVMPEDLMIAMSGATTGKLAFNKSDKTYLLNQRVGIIRPYFISKKFLYHYLNTKIEENLNKSSGSAIPNLSTKQIREIKFPLPPPEEQKRIVRNIETLFAQVDELEQKVRQDRQVDKRLQVAVLNDLQRAETPEASRRSWQHLTDHFEQIYRKPEHIDQLKQAILNEAVRGRLVPQDPSDEPAEKLLERIKAEKQRLYEEGEIRKPKELDPITKGQVPYDLPENWCWSRLRDLCFDIHYGHTTSADETIQTPKFLRITDIHDNKVNWETVPGCVIEEENIPKYKLEDGDILIARTGGTVGKSFLVENVQDQAIFASYLIRLIPYNFNLAKYLRRYLDSAFYWYQIDESKKGTGQPNVNATKLGDLLFPLSPQDEQKRIVKKADELLSWCDDLKSTLSRSRQTDRRLLEALVQQATEEKGENEETREATILPFPQRRKVGSKIKKVSGLSTIDTQAGSMCRIFVLYDNYNGPKEHFGRTKTEKTNHIIESHAKIDMGRMPKRMARGAADFQRLLNKVEYKAQKKGWFTATEINGVIHYRKGTRFIEPYQKLDYKLGDKKAEVDRIIKLFIPLTTREAEVRQTVYAAWHDLIAYGQSPSNGQVVEWSSTEKYWTEEKEEIPKHEFYEAIKWLRGNDLVPDGKGKLTVKE